MTHSYSTPESFSRAFERFHGVLPSEIKNSTVKTYSRLSIKIILEGGSVMDYRIEELNSFKVLGKCENQIIGNVQVGKFWDKCREDGTFKILKKFSISPEKEHIGFVDGSSYDTKSYMYYIVTPYEGGTVPEGFIKTKCLRFGLPQRKGRMTMNEIDNSSLDLYNKEVSLKLFDNKRINTLVGVNKDAVLLLGKSGFSFMKNLLKVTRTKNERIKLSDELNIQYEDLYRIVLCCDMAQVVGLSGKLLFYLYETGYCTLKSFQEANPDEINNAVLDYLSKIGKKPTLPACSRPGNWLGAARLIESVIELD